MANKINTAASVPPFIVMDFETGGFKCQKNAVTEIAALCIHGGTLQEVGRFESYIQPYEGYEYDDAALKATSISISKLKSQGKPLVEVVDAFLNKVTEWHKATSQSSFKKPILVGHNLAGFDLGFLEQILSICKRDGGKYFSHSINFHNQVNYNCFDTLHMARAMWGGKGEELKYTLSDCCMRANLELIDAHKAINDVIATKDLFVYFLNQMRGSNVVGKSEISTDGRYRNNFKFQFSF
jgi:DNA polymerase III alpha subunit (gram-positive type)